MKPKKRILTGVTTSGSPHIGNLVGAVLPAIEASKSRETDSFLFLADFLGLNLLDLIDLLFLSFFFFLFILLVNLITVFMNIYSLLFYEQNESS